MKRVLLGILVLIILIFLIWLFVFYVREKRAVRAINSFEACAANGYPVMESYPRKCATPDGRTFVEGVVFEPALPGSGGDQMSGGSGPGGFENENIRITSLRAGDTINSPLTIEGEAKGTWFFEASFPVHLIDGAGEEIIAVPAQAQGEWMTENFVPFKALLTFANISSATGTLVFKKDNPSGLPEHDDSVSIPIVFASSTLAL